MKPAALKPGDTIGVMAPSSWVERDDIEKSKALLEARGFKVFVHPQTYERHNQSAGDELQKTLAFQGLWQRADISVVWAAGGGNRAMHFMDSINYNALKKKPKILIGFSDVTCLLNGVYAHTGIPTFHGPVFKNIHKYGQLDHLLGLLSGEKSTYDLSKADVIIPGKAEGKLIGGNLSIFQYLPETLPGKFWKNSILFLEDCSDELSRIDRMMLHLKRNGVFSHVRGIVFGEFIDMQDSTRPYGFTLRDIVAAHTDGLEIPVVMNAPFGHGATLFAFPVSIKATLDTTMNNLFLRESAVKN